jgi:hypothetical protein
VTRLRQPRLVAGFALIAGATVVAGLGVSGVASDIASTPSASDPKIPPLTGVYTYLTNGSESIGDSAHVYPGKTTISVVQTACGVSLQWHSLPGRSTTWTLCRGSKNIIVRGFGETRVVSGKTVRTTYSCTQHALQFTCDAPGGSATGRLVVEGETVVPVATSGISALQIEALTTVNGSSQGTRTTNWWLADRTLLPVRITVDDRTSRTEPKVGAVQYRENATLQLVSTTPRR